MPKTWEMPLVDRNALALLTNDFCHEDNPLRDRLFRAFERAYMIGFIEGSVDVVAIMDVAQICLSETPKGEEVAH